ncbi:hypothetical protein QTP70_029657, partial [Hemibagrus guttatus]
MAEYRQRKAQSDGQKKKKKKKNKGSEQQEGEQEECHERKDVPPAELSFSRTLQSGDTVKHDQTYTIEPESEISTTAEDYSSEEEEIYAPSRLQEMENELAAKNMAVEELSRELEEIRATFGAEGVQQLQDFEAALKQRDSIITQLTANLQQARAEKDEVMREFLDLTEKSQKLQIQFQQARNVAYRLGDRLPYSNARRQLKKGITAAKQRYQQQIEGHFVNNNPRSMWRGIKAITDYKSSTPLTSHDALNEFFARFDNQTSQVDTQTTPLPRDEPVIILESHQLQAGESLRSSSISSAAADLLQARQQVLLYQQQLDEKDATVKSLQMQLEDRDGKIKGLREQTEETDKKVKHLQEQISQMMQIQQRVFELEMVSRDTEVSFTQRLQEKDLRIKEQERLILEHQQSLSQLRDKLEESDKRFVSISEQLEAKVRDLEGCEAELQASKEKEQLSSGEILQLMGTVEDLQKRYHQGNQLEGEVLKRAEEYATQRLDHLRAELDEMYGQQIVQIKQELIARHKEEMANILEKHSTEMKKILDQHRVETKRLTSQLNHSTGDVNSLNVRVIELQQRLQELQVLREKAEHDLTQTSKEKILLQSQVQQLVEDLRLKEQEKSQSEVHLQLQATITDLQAQLTSVQEASSELEAKHESEITNYQIKLEMLEREKDAVLDRMAESQEAELERLRTQLLFSHEEELSRLREDLQHESQMNVENLQDELNQRHEESLQHLRSGYEEQIRLSVDERSVLAAERTSLLQEIVTLKSDLKQAQEKSQVEELVAQLKALQAEIQELRQRPSEKVEPQELYKNDRARESEQSWEEVEAENKLLKETIATLTEELRSREADHKMLMKKIDTLITENRQANELAEELRAEIERQKSTFSFAEKNFEVNYQELRAELEERLRVQALQYETKLQGFETQLQNPKSEMEYRSIQSMKKEHEETDGGALVEKDTTELMEKLQSVELARAGLVKQVEQKETEIKKIKLERVKLEEQLKSREMEFKIVEQEKTGLLEQVEQKEAKIKMVELEKVGLVEQLGQNKVELKRLELERAGFEEQTKLKDLELKRVELEKIGLVQQVDQKEAALERVKLEKAELLQQVEWKEAKLQRVTETEALVKVVEQKEVVLQQKKEELQRMKPGKAELTDQHQVKKAGLKAPRKTRQKASRVKGLESKSDTKKKGQSKSQCFEVELQEEEVVTTEQLLALPLSQAAEEEERLRETDVYVVHCNDGVKLQTHAYTKTVAVGETLSCAHTDTHTRTHTHTRTQPSAAASHTAREKKLKSDSEKQVESQYGETDLVPTVTLTDSMEGYEHEECRLQLEAQRISLSQIHAAQLELLKERLPEWEEPERQGMAKESASSPSLSSITQDFTHLLQLISGVCGVDTVDVTDEQLQNLQPCTIRKIIDTTQEVYRKLQQLDAGVLSSHTSFSVTSLNEDGNECKALTLNFTLFTIFFTVLQEELQEEVKQKMELQEEVKQKMELQEEVKQKVELQEEVKQKVELQEEVKQKVELQEEVKQKVELQEEVKQKVELQEEVKQKVELQEEVKQKVELQEEVKQKVELQEEVKQKMALQEEVKQKVELQEEVKQKVELQEEVKQKVELQEEVKQKVELQEEVKQKMALQEEQHRQEIQCLRSYYSEQIREMEERFTNEVLLLQDVTPADTLHSMPSISAKEQQLQVRYSALLVIVQMSVEFAKQSEMSRMSMQDKPSEGTQ